METTIDVTGMTCAHCEASVGEELMTVAGVTAVSGDAASAAVAEAGYALG